MSRGEEDDDGIMTTTITTRLRPQYLHPEIIVAAGCRDSLCLAIPIDVISFGECGMSLKRDVIQIQIFVWVKSNNAGSSAPFIFRIIFVPARDLTLHAIDAVTD